MIHSLKIYAIKSIADNQVSYSFDIIPKDLHNFLIGFYNFFKPRLYKNNNVIINQINFINNYDSFKEKLFDYYCKTKKNNLEVIKYIFENGLDKNNISKKLIDEIILSNKLELIIYLVNNGIKINKSNSYLLSSSAINNHFDMVKFLINYGFESHQLDDHALIAAVRSKNLEIVKYLVENGAKPFVNSSILIAVEKEQINILKYLVEQGADPLANNNYALLIASNRCNKFEIIKYLIDLIGNNKVHYMEQIISNIIIRLNNDIVKYIINCGDDIESNYKIALNYIISYTNKTDLAKEIINEHITFITKETCYVFDYIISHNKYELFNYLNKKYNYDNDIKSHIIKNIIRYDNPKLLDNMISKCKNIDLITFEPILISHISNYNSIKLLKYLIENNKLNINSCNNTFIYLSVLSNSLDIIKYIIKSNTSLKFTQENLNEYLEFSLKAKYRKLIKYLINLGANTNDMNMLKQIIELKDLRILKDFVKSGTTLSNNNIDELINFARQHKKLSMIKYLKTFKQ